MIAGIGTDIIKISRIENIKREHGDKFLNKIFTDREKEYCEKYDNSSEHYAVRFAAKEAIAKALGVQLWSAKIPGNLAWKDIDVSNDEQGKPIVFFRGETADKMDKYTCHVSLSHCTDYATAVSVIELK